MNKRYHVFHAGTGVFSHRRRFPPFSVISSPDIYKISSLFCPPSAVLENIHAKIPDLIKRKQFNNKNPKIG